jgi:hypothetical protein
MHHTLILLAIGGLTFSHIASAQVYKCMDSGGKTVYAQTPCATKPDTREKLVDATPAMSTDSGASPRNFAAEHAAAGAPADAGRQEFANQAAPFPPRNQRKPASAGLTDRQIIANCEANHGTRCSSAGEIAQRRMEQRELTPSERQQQQSAVAARRQRQQDEAFNRSIRR